MCAVFNRNQDSFETIEGIAKGAAKQVKKATVKTVADVVGDVKESVGMEQAQPAVAEAMAGKQVNQAGKMDQKNLARWRENVKRIEAEMKKAREEREKKRDQAIQASQASQTKQAEKRGEEKKKESVLQRLTKTKQGTKEGMARVSG